MADVLVYRLTMPPLGDVRDLGEEMVHGQESLKDRGHIALGEKDIPHATLSEGIKAENVAE